VLKEFNVSHVLSYVILTNIFSIIYDSKNAIKLYPFIIKDYGDSNK